MYTNKKFFVSYLSISSFDLSLFKSSNNMASSALLTFAQDSLN